MWSQGDILNVVLRLRIILGEKAFPPRTAFDLQELHKKIKTGDISIVEKAETFLLWYDSGASIS
jgi:hypothetical protein